VADSALPRGWALVTGGGRRVGRAIALELGRIGMNVLVHYRSSEGDARAVVSSLREMGREAEMLSADLASPAEVADLAATSLARSGGIDLLVNNASNYFRTPWGQLDEGAWNTALDVNLKAPYLLSIAIGGDMRTRRGGTIVNLVDCCTERPQLDYLPYVVSKGGLVTLTKALARELAPAVRVNAVAPGPVLLPDGSTEEYRDAVRRATPLGLGTAEAVAQAVRFLFLDATFTTGEVLHVDGGRALA